WSHPDLTTLGDAEVAEEIGRNKEFLRTTLGVADTPFFRPPFGARDERTDRIAADLGHPTIAMWNGTLGDSRVLTGAELVGYAREWFAPQAIVVGSKDFTEQLILGELVAQTIERQAKLGVTRRFDLGGNLAHDALVAGEIDAYVEYTGTALMAVLKQPPQTDPASVLKQVKTDYATRFNLTWTEPLGFGNTFAILVRADEAEKHHLKTISQAAALAPRWRAGFGQDFMSRPDGYAGFARAYGLRFSGAPREMDLSLTYRALKDGQVDLIAGNATDGLIARYGLVQLEDDRRYFPPYDAVPVVRQAVLDAHPALRGAFKRLGGVLTVDAMRELNFQVDGERRDPKAVVADFLTKRGL
ncbi:MAG: glycine betaine ABC transporter substrate-binding protein, partial [Candidatus Sericytochromatia bacterium]